jgi:NAD(P)-dependent dehydrogenase (short-subunit alcohol dehydrogenase family)
MFASYTQGTLMNDQGRTAIVTGASQGIGAGVVTAFAERGFNVVANSRRIWESKEVAGSDKIALVEGDIGDPATAQRVAATAQSRFGRVDVLVNNAGIFFTKPFTDYTAEDFRSLISTNVEGSCTSRNWPSSRCQRRRLAGASSRSRRPLPATQSAASRRRCR